MLQFMAYNAYLYQFLCLCHIRLVNNNILHSDDIAATNFNAHEYVK